MLINNQGIDDDNKCFVHVPKLIAVEPKNIDVETKSNTVGNDNNTIYAVMVD